MTEQAWNVDFRGVLSDQARAAMERADITHLTSGGAGTAGPGGRLPEMSHHTVAVYASTRAAAVDRVMQTLAEHGPYVAFRARRTGQHVVDIRLEEEAVALALERAAEDALGAAVWRNATLPDEDGVTVEVVLAQHDYDQHDVVDVAVPRAEQLAPELIAAIERRIPQALPLWDREDSDPLRTAVARSPYVLGDLVVGEES